MTARVLVNTEGLTEQEWLEWRRRGLGGSDAPCVVGLSPWRSPLDCWLEKLGETSGQAETERMYWGKRLEAVVADEYARRHPEIGLIERPEILQHEQYEWMLASLDREIIGDPRGPGVLEVKTATPWDAAAWDDGHAPEHYQIQAQHYMAVRGCRWGAFAVLIGGSDYREIEVERDDKLIGYLIHLEERFWQHVLNRTMPDLDGSEATARALALLYPQAEQGSIVDLPAEAADLIEDRALHAGHIAFHEDAKTEAENRLKALTGAAEIGCLDGKPAVKWGSVTQRRLDGKTLRADHPVMAELYTRESTYRRFHVYRIKEADG